MVRSRLGRWTSRLRNAVTLAAVATVVAAGSGAMAAPSAPVSVPAVGAAPIDARWSQPGPSEVTVAALDAAHTVYRPSDLDAGGRHPVIIWGNGTGVTPQRYDGLLRHWASHGFVVAAANTRSSGSGREMLAGATTLIRENDRPGSPYHERIDTSRIGATGHSQGGGGAIAAGADPLVTTTVPIEPGPQDGITTLRGPMFILGGQFDLVVPPPLLVIPRYNEATHIPAVYGELAGAGHTTPTGDGGGFRGATTAWFRFWLAGDADAGRVFFGACTICGDAAWSEVLRNDRAVAVSPDPAG